MWLIQKKIIIKNKKKVYKKCQKNLINQYIYGK